MSHARLLSAVFAVTLLGIETDGLWAKERQYQFEGYLTDNAFDVMMVLPPPPSKGDARDTADRRIFRETRKLVGTLRYALATRDVEGDASAMLKDFSCAMGVVLTSQNAPKIMRVVERSRVDSSQQINRAKDIYRRLRPFKVDKGEICQPKAHFDSYDYPSGHTTAGWTAALVLAQLAPESASSILARGRAYGESRFVCGAHNESAVEAGRLAASATMAVVQASPDFQADLAAARIELQALRLSARTPAPETCAKERKLVGQPVF